MTNNANEPYNFDDCYICTASRRAESKGVSLSEKELVEAFAVQAERSKPAPVTPTESVGKQSESKSNNNE